MAFGNDKNRRKNRPRETLLRAAVRSGERRRAIRRRVLALLGVLLGGPALAVGLYWGGHHAWLGMFAENPFFEIRRIDVTTDGTLGVADIQEYARVRPGLNLFAVRPQDIRAALLAVPVIADAQVGRRLPDGLVIEVTERIAVARLGRPGAGSPLALDATGHVLGPSSVRISLPVIQGVRDVGLRPGDVVADPMLQDALAILDVCNDEKMRAVLSVASVDVGDEERIEVGLASGERVWLSRDRVQDKLWQLREMLKTARSRGLALATYDMTVDRNYVGRSAEAAETP
ncbi:MAG: cell division protein FtsQ/DivIB [Kiritimatiellia bacterium]